MDKYRIEVRLLSEAIFGSGYSKPGSIDLEIVCDECGIPFMKAKTFKGNFREAMEETIDLLELDGGLLKKLLGSENGGINAWKTLRFSDCAIAESVRKILIASIQEGKIDQDEIKDSLTQIRSFTSIDDDGSASDGSLRQIRVIKKGLIFNVVLSCERDLTKKELGLIAASVRNLRHIGTMRTRGKGEVECTLKVLDQGCYVDKTNYYIDELIKEVKSNV